MANNCDGLPGADRISCELMNMFGAQIQSAVQKPKTDGLPSEEKLWQCVEDRFVKAGGTKEELFNKVNKGFEAEPTGLKRFVNDPGALELQEKLEFAYSDPKNYDCLNEAGYPNPFAMNDFGLSELFDDQMRYEIETTIDKIKEEVAADAEKFPPGSDARTKELTQRIYAWAEETLKFNDDCKVEGADHESIAADCGRCSESTAIMYFAFTYAGLAPKFLYFRDFEPTLEWIDIIPQLTGMAQAHVFIGIPMANGETLQVDLINKKFDAKYSIFTEISPRQFVVEWLENKRIDFDGLHEWDKSKFTDKLAINIAPEDMRAYFSLKLTYKTLDQAEDCDVIRQKIETLFAGNPNAAIELSLSDIEDEAGLLQKMAAENDPMAGARAKELGDNLNAQLKALAEKDPNLASMILYRIGAQTLRKILPEFMSMVKARRDGTKVGEAKFEFLKTALGEAVGNIGKSLAANPNNMFAFKDVNAAFNATDSFETAVSMYEALLQRHSAHPPFLHAAAFYCLQQAESGNADKTGDVREEEKKRFLNKALGFIERLQKLDEGHPAPRQLLAQYYALKEDFGEAIGALAHANELIRQRGQKAPKQNYVDLHTYQLLGLDSDGADDTMEMALADYPGEAAAFLSESLRENFTWSLDAGKENTPIRDDVLAFPPGMEEKMVAMLKTAGKAYKRLSKYGDARENVDAAMAYSLPAISFYLGAGTAEDWFDEIDDKSSVNVQRSFAKGLDKITGFLITSRGTVNVERYRSLEETFGLVEPVLDGSLKPLIVAAEAGVVRGYILSGDEDAADELLSKILTKDVYNPMRFPSIVGDIFKNSQRSETGIKRTLLALDLFWKHREQYCPELHNRLGKMYGQIAPACKGAGLLEEASLAEDRAKELLQ